MPAAVVNNKRVADDRQLLQVIALPRNVTGRRWKRASKETSRVLAKSAK